jgi:2-polyprenyl-6-methoxyphenol hydroxylase-like FAD-dependent oxidoreductase
MTSESTLPIIIVGAGIGGLTAALHLHAHGLTNLHIYEAAAELKTLGVGINIQPHAILILRNLGLLDALIATGITTQDMYYYNRHGDQILIEKRGIFAGYEIPQISMHRGELQMLLLQAVRERIGEERIHLGHAFTKFEQDKDGITAFFNKRSTSPNKDFNPSKRGCIVVAADGINSVARQLLYPEEGPPCFSGRMLWRGCIEREPYLSGASMLWGGHSNQKFIAYPISAVADKRGKSLVNWICAVRVRDENDQDTTVPKTNWLETVDKSKFLPQFKGWEMGGLQVHEIVEATSKVFEFPMCDRGEFFPLDLS